MIPRDYLEQWGEVVPWKEFEQVEQDLVLSRAIVEIFSDDVLKKTLLFRGGTALYKLHVQDQIRYSEDLDFVMIDKGPIGPVYDAVREKLDPLLGEPGRDQKESMAVMSYTYETECPPRGPQTLKLEINYEEDFSVLEQSEEPFKLDNPWFSGEATAPTFKPDEMMTTKLRTLFQRNKGRNLFDLWFTITEGLVDLERILRCFEQYTANLDPPITRARFEKNPSEKVRMGNFERDVIPLWSSIRPWCKSGIPMNQFILTTFDFVLL